MRIFQNISRFIVLMLPLLGVVSCSGDDNDCSDIDFVGTSWDIIEITDDSEYSEYAEFYFLNSVIYFENDFMGHIKTQASDSVALMYSREHGMAIRLENVRYYVEGKMSHIGNLITYKYRWDNEPRMISHTMKWLKTKSQ